MRKDGRYDSYNMRLDHKLVDKVLQLSEIQTLDALYKEAEQEFRVSRSSLRATMSEKPNSGVIWAQPIN